MRRDWEERQHYQAEKYLVWCQLIEDVLKWLDEPMFDSPSKVTLKDCFKISALKTKQNQCSFRNQFYADNLPIVFLLYTHTHTHTHIYMWIYIHTHTHTYVYIYIHTHTHIYTLVVFFMLVVFFFSLAFYCRAGMKKNKYVKWGCIPFCKFRFHTWFLLLIPKTHSKSSIKDFLPFA